MSFLSLQILNPYKRILFYVKESKAFEWKNICRLIRRNLFINLEKNVKMLIKISKENNSH